MSSIKAFFAAHPAWASAARHFAATSVAVFLVAVLPVFQNVGAGHPISVSDAKAAALAGITGVIAAAARTVVPLIAGFVSRNPAPPAA